MLFSSTTDVYSDFGAVVSTAFNDFWPYLVLVCGIVLGFYVAEVLISLITGKKEETGYYMGNERIKDQELAKNIYEVQNKGMTRFK